MTTPISYDDLLARVRDLMASMQRSPVIGICGHGGAGTSTLAARLTTDVGGRSEQVVTTDRFHAVGAGPASGLFELHDWSVLIALLHRLRATPAPRRLAYPVRTYDGAERTCDVTMPPVVVVEGIRLIRPETVPLLDLAVWIDLSPPAAAAELVGRALWAAGLVVVASGTLGGCRP